MAPAGNDRQRLPPTVAVPQILNDASSAVQHWCRSGAAGQSGRLFWSFVDSVDSSASVQVAARSIPLSLKVIGSQPSPVMSTSLRMSACGSENSQVPPARIASPGPSGHTSSRRVGVCSASTVLRSIYRP